MKYEIIVSNRFKKDFKRCIKRGLDMKLITNAMTILSETGTLPPEYHPHILSATRAGQWECHIAPNWLMVWEQNDITLTLLFLQTGTHADIFG
ncbi:MAG: type II toxin-antitoxin system YafQ family toxin [Victivallales bacterium]|nr:type II toxin-antitoxin system YafQ family toxin [Victivallales bacterium]